MQKIKKSYLTILENYKLPKFDLFLTFRILEKRPLVRFNHIHMAVHHQHPPWEAACQNNKVIKQFWIKWPASEK